MKILLRSTLAVTCLFVLALALAALGTDPAAQADGESSLPTPTQAPVPPRVDLPPALQLEEPLTQAGCTASTTCSDGSMLSCTGGFGETCLESSESCTVADCSGSRNFVQCGATKQVCPCDTGGCVPCSNPNSCTPGAKCKTQDQCGVCGGCLRGQCVCISPG